MLGSPKAPLEVLLVVVVAAEAGIRDIILLALELVNVSPSGLLSGGFGELLGEQGGESSWTLLFVSFPGSLNMFPAANGRNQELLAGSVGSQIMEGGLAGSYSASPGMGRLITGHAGSYSFFADM